MTAGRVLVILLIAAGATGMAVNGAVFYARLLYVGLLLIVASWFSVRVVARGLRLTRRADFYRAAVGDIYKEQYEVFNSSRFSGAWVELHNDMALPMATGSRLLTRLRPREKQTFVTRSWLTKRGGFPVGPTRLVVADTLGLFRVERRFHPKHNLVVLPLVYPVRGFLQPPGFLPGGKVINRKSVDVTPHAAGVRPYAPGDPMRRIHWPTTARRAQLIVKEFEQDPQAEVWLFLDAEARVQAEAPYAAPEVPVESLLFMRKPRLTLPPSTIEYSVSIGASLARYFISQKRAVGLVTRDRAHTVLAAERSERQVTKILETLAFVEGKGDQSIAALVGAHAPLLPKGSTVVLITPTTSKDTLLVADDLQRRRLKPIVVLLAARGFGGPSGTDQLATALRNHGIPLRLVECGGDLAEALSAFAGDDRPQDGFAWQRPVLSHLT